MPKTKRVLRPERPQTDMAMAKLAMKERMDAVAQMENDLLNDMEEARMTDDQKAAKAARTKEMQKAEEAKAEEKKVRLAEMGNRERVRRLDEVAKNLLTVCKGVNIREVTLVVDLERNITKKIQDKDTVSMHDRAEALKVLWAFAFKGDEYKQHIMQNSGVGALKCLFCCVYPQADMSVCMHVVCVCV